MIDQLRAICIFAKTAEMGSFRAAAEALGLSPSVVSYQVSQLEKTHGVALLYRSTRKLSLTYEGQQLLVHARQIMEAAEQGLDGLAGVASSQTGRLRISVPAAFSGGYLLDDIAAYAASNPGVELDINFSDRHQDLVEQGIDVAIRTGNLEDSSLKARRLTPVRRVLVATPGYVAKMDRPQSPLDLVNWDWIHFSLLPPARKFSKSRVGSKTVKFQSRISVDNAEALCRLAIAGLGLATPPEFLVQDDLESGILEEVLPGWRLEPLPMQLVWPGNSPRQSLTAKFVDCMVDRQNESGFGRPAAT